MINYICDTEESGAATCIAGNPHDVIIWNLWVQVVAQDSFFSSVSSVTNLSGYIYMKKYQK